MRILSQVLVAVCLLSAAKTLHAEAATTTYADIEVKVDGDKIEKGAAGIRTLFITIYDEASKMPMPYGALKIELTKDAKDSIYKGKLDTNNIMVMGGGDAPKTLRIKAKLDKDGSAGSDSPGDLVGIAEHVALGSKVVVKINKAI